MLSTSEKELRLSDNRLKHAIFHFLSFFLKILICLYKMTNMEMFYLIAHV